MQKIYIVEDDENIRELVAYALNTARFETKTFERASELWEIIDKSGNIPDLILLDIMLPGEDGIATLKKLRSLPEYRGIPVIMLTAKSSEYDKVKGLDLGADDYVTKPFGVLELISRIKAVLRRTQSADEIGTVLQVEEITLDALKHTVTVEGNEVSLTYKEFELLQYLLQNMGLVLSRDKIIERVWGYDFEGESRTVDMHIKTLRQKIGDNGTVIETVRGIGYKIRGER